MPITSYSTTPASNTSISGINIAEGCLPSNINDAIRQLMADIASAIGTNMAPVTDTNPIVKGSADATKQVRFEVDGLTTATTRVITPPNADTSLLTSSFNHTLSGPTTARTYTLPDSSVTIPGVAAATTFTPALSFGGASTGITYTTQSGFYLQLTNGYTWIWFDIVLSNKGSATGSAAISLPVTSSLGFNHTASIGCDAMTGLTGNLLGLVQNGSNSLVIRRESNGTNSSTDQTIFTNTSVIRGGLFFKA